MAAKHVLVMVVQSVAITGDAANRQRRARSIFEAAGRAERLKERWGVLVYFEFKFEALRVDIVPLQDPVRWLRW